MFDYFAIHSKSPKIEKIQVSTCAQSSSDGWKCLEDSLERDDTHPHRHSFLHVHGPRLAILVFINLLSYHISNTYKVVILDIRQVPFFFLIVFLWNALWSYIFISQVYEIPDDPHKFSDTLGRFYELFNSTSFHNSLGCLLKIQNNT